MTARSAPALIVHQCRYELRALRRDRQAGLTTVLMPILLLIAFVGLAGRHTHVVQDGHNVSVARFYVPGLIAFAVVGASFATLIVEIVALRQSGVFKRRRATPVPSWALIGGRTLSCAIVALITTAVLLALGRNSYNLRLPSSALLPIALTLLVGTTAFACFAYALAPFVRDARSVQPVIQIVLLPLYIISGVLLPDSKTPHLLREIAAVFPLQHLAHGLHRAVESSHPGIGMATQDLAILTGWVVIALAIAIRRFRWLPY